MLAAEKKLHPYAASYTTYKPQHIPHTLITHSEHMHIHVWILKNTRKISQTHFFSLLLEDKLRHGFHGDGVVDGVQRAAEDVHIEQVLPLHPHLLLEAVQTLPAGILRRQVAGTQCHGPAYVIKVMSKPAHR